MMKTPERVDSNLCSLVDLWTVQFLALRLHLVRLQCPCNVAVKRKLIQRTVAKKPMRCIH